MTNAPIPPLRALRIALADTALRHYARSPEPAPWEKPRKHEPVDVHVTFCYETHYSYGAGVFAYRTSGYGVGVGHVASPHKDPMRAQFEAVRTLVDEDINRGTGDVLRHDWVVLDVQALPCPLGETPTLRWHVRLALHHRVDRARGR